jgi:hypothetical protein
MLAYPKQHEEIREMTDDWWKGTPLEQEWKKKAFFDGLYENHLKERASVKLFLALPLPVSSALGLFFGGFFAHLGNDFASWLLQLQFHP